MENVSITTSVTQIVAADAARGVSSNAILLIRNDSDTDIRIAIGDANIALLTSSLGFLLEPGDIMAIDGISASRKISGIHGGSGNKTIHWQLV